MTLAETGEHRNETLGATLLSVLEFLLLLISMHASWLAAVRFSTAAVNLVFMR